MVDLTSQYDTIKSSIDQKIARICESGAYINGPDVKAFAEEFANYLNVNHVIPCASGTDALQIALMAHNFQTGDEVIVPDMTYAATAEVVGLLGLQAVIVDVDPNTFTMDTEQLQRAISDRTVAIMPVHLYGQCADMEEILHIATKNQLAVIEDTAQAGGAEYEFSWGGKKKAGTMGHIGAISFFPTKNLGAFGDGGAIMTNDAHLAEVCHSICNHGQSAKYVHDRIGVNSRLDTMQAGILRIKLEHLDDYNQKRQSAASVYDQLLQDVPSIQTPVVHPKSNHVYHQYTIQINEGDRDEIKEMLAEDGIPSVVYYPRTISNQKGCQPFSRKVDNACPVAEELSQKVLSLPLHTELSQEQQQYICEHLTKTIEQAV